MSDLFINGSWFKGEGGPLNSSCPYSGDSIYSGQSASKAQVDEAVTAAKKALITWQHSSLENRIRCVEQFATLLKSHELTLATAISQENGKPLWEAKSEVTTMINKVAISIDAQKKRASHQIIPQSTDQLAIRYKPHGVMAVIGPFNFPGHLSNGHIIPSLLAGNTVVFKQSEWTPKVGQEIAKLWSQTDLPPGVFNLIQGSGDVGQSLTNHCFVQGVLFTGSFQVGQKIAASLVHNPGKIVALEMGGNNPLICWDASQILDAALIIFQSAYLSSGQRCTCARRLILPKNDFGTKIISTLSTLIDQVRIGRYDAEPSVFYGPLTSLNAANQLLDFQERLEKLGGRAIRKSLPVSGHPQLITPGLMDTSDVQKLPDEEIFAPFLQVQFANDFEQAISFANDTLYGLASGLISESRELYDQFYDLAKAGVINWNRPLTGASSQAPFGGTNHSGNHRPSAYFAADYCQYPVAPLEATNLPSANWPQGFTPFSL